ncbi:MAG: poly-beta-1,6-N-acetyl-D-glucosamine synthase [Agitococcus sp.]|nr:poly-beta-1,6-N-acetyl-D-glucosamine synthase [Agitococcus sp.]
MTQFASGLLAFCFFYPLIMSYVWMGGAWFFYLRFERNDPPVNQPPLLKEYPKVAFMVPCYNEGDNVRGVVANLMDTTYPDFEIIAINDGSKDNTGVILDELLTQCPLLRVVHQAENHGKAMALNAAALMTDAEIFICIDGDALLHPDAARWMVRHFVENPRVGAVTGNPRVRTRSTILGRIQVGEFSSIIGLIKRAQRTYGRVFSVSGVVAAFSRRALHDVGYWANDMLTEDIDITWRLQLRHWDVRFEPAALCWILMPETIKGLWGQRLRWSMGGAQALLKYRGLWLNWKSRRMALIYLEYLTSLCWGYVMTLNLFVWILGFFIEMPKGLPLASLQPGVCGLVLALTGFLQVGLGMYFDRKYEVVHFRNIFVLVWYPIAYWMIGWFTAVWGFPKALFRQEGALATWVSPDRGVR